jgi:glutamate synthase domain-containing protein 2
MPLFTKKISEDTAQELARLYQEREPLNAELLSLKADVIDMQNKINTYRDFESSYDESDYITAMKFLDDTLDEANSNIKKWPGHVSLNRIQQEIISIETKEYGEAKLPLLDQLQDLYLARPHLVEQHNEMVQMIMKVQEDISTFKSFESHYLEKDPVAYKNHMIKLNDSLKTLQNDLRKSPITPQLHQLDDRIIELEFKVYGEAKLSSPSSAQTYNRTKS